MMDFLLPPPAAAAAAAAAAAEIAAVVLHRAWCTGLPCSSKTYLTCRHTTVVAHVMTDQSAGPAYRIVVLRSCGCVRAPTHRCAASLAKEDDRRYGQSFVPCQREVTRSEGSRA